jgi:hypothetical protein
MRLHKVRNVTHAPNNYTSLVTNLLAKCVITSLGSHTPAHLRKLGDVGHDSVRDGGERLLGEEGRVWRDEDIWEGLEHRELEVPRAHALRDRHLLEVGEEQRACIAVHSLRRFEARRSPP